MNGVAIVLLVIGLAMLVIGMRNHQDNLLSAITGKPVGKTTLG